MLYKPKFSPPLWVIHHKLHMYTAMHMVINLYCFSLVNESLISLIYRVPANEPKMGGGKIVPPHDIREKQGPLGSLGDEGRVALQKKGLLSCGR